MSHVPTVKVKPWGDDQGEFVIINADDFDPERHVMHAADEVSEAPKRARKAKAKE